MDATTLHSYPRSASQRIFAVGPMASSSLHRAARAQATGEAVRAFHSSTTSCRSTPGWTLTLERGIGKAYGAEAELQATTAFTAEVFPDLPIATTWQNLAKALTGRLGTTATEGPAPAFTHYTTRPGALKVITAAANLRSEQELELRILQAAGDGVEASGGQRADVLLCVSGSHPVRTLPLVSRFLRSSLDTLRVAQRLKRQGHIPPSTQLWVVANPNKEGGAALLEAKAALGADVVLTQPPLDWPAYLAWMGDAERRGLLNPAPPRASTAPASAPLIQPPPATSPSCAAASSPSGPAPRPYADSVDGGDNPSATALAAKAATGEAPNGGSTDAAGGGLRVLDGDRGGDGRVRLFVGHPVISSMANLSFWVALSGCGGSPEAQRLVAEAARAEMEGSGAAARHVMEYNRRLTQQVLERGGVAGMHVMPITKAAKRMAIQMLEEGTLPRSEA